MKRLIGPQKNCGDAASVSYNLSVIHLVHEPLQNMGRSTGWTTGSVDLRPGLRPNMLDRRLFYCLLKKFIARDGGLGDFANFNFRSGKGGSLPLLVDLLKIPLCLYFLDVYI